MCNPSILPIRLAGHAWLVLWAMTCPFAAQAQYSPGDTPIGWTADGLLFFRAQVWVWETSYTNEDAYDVSCQGSGLYALAPDASVEEVLTGEPVCELAFADHWDLSEDAHSLLVGHIRGKRDDLPVVSVLDLSTHDRRVFLSDGEEILQSPTWVGPGVWAYVGRAYPKGKLRITATGPEDGRLLAELERGWIESFDRVGGHLMVRGYTLADRVTLFDTLGVPVAEWPAHGTSGWTRRGNRIAYLRVVNELPEAGLVSARPADWALIVRDVTTGEETELFRTDRDSVFEKGHAPSHRWGPFRDGTPRYPLVWSPDGSHIVFPRTFEDGTTLWRVPVDGGGAVQLTFRDPATAPPAPQRPVLPPRVVRAPDEAPSDLTAANLDAMAAVIGHFATRTVDGQMLCLTFLQDARTIRPAPDALIEEAQNRWPNVTDACPRTYARMFVLTDSLGRRIVDEPPPGHVDPQHLSVGLPRNGEDGSSQIDAHVRQGTSGRSYGCVVPPEANHESVRCRLQSTWIS